jgi:hypothetical protein
MHGESSQLHGVFEQSPMGMVPGQALSYRQRQSEAASITCDKVKNLGNYVIVISEDSPATCTTGLISSATVEQITQVTN